MSLSILAKKACVGVDIGHKFIKIVQVDRSGPVWKLIAWTHVPTPSDSVKEGQILDSDAVGLAIKTALKEAKINASHANISVAGGSVIVRNARVPKMTDATLRKSIRYEAARYVPASIEDSFIDFEIRGTAPDGQMEVQIVAAPKTLVNSRIRACQIADLKVDAVDIETFAMHRTIVESDESSALNSMTVALIDVGAMTTTVSVVLRGMFTMSRTIPHGGQTLTEALKAYFKLTDADAESGKGQLDLNPLLQEREMDNPPLRVLQPHVDDLVREIRRSLNYYQSQQSEAGHSDPVTHLVIAGGGARLGGLTSYFSHKLGIPSICRGVLDHPRIVAPAGLTDSSGMEFTVAAGLAMKPNDKAA